MRKNGIQQHDSLEGFGFESDLRGSCKIIRLKGRFLEHECGLELLQEIESDLTERHCLVVDLGQLQLLNSEGIGCLIRIIRMVNREKGRLVFCRVPSKVQELFDIIRLNSLLSICGSEEEALQSLMN